MVRAIGRANLPAILLHDRLYNVQPQARSARRYVRFEDSLEQLRRDSRTVVTHHNLNARRYALGRDINSPAAWHRTHRIRKEIDQHSIPSPVAAQFDAALHGLRETDLAAAALRIL